MDTELPDEIRLLKETIRKFVDRELIPIETKARDEDGDLKPELRAKLEEKAKALGLWHLDMPEDYGGHGLSLLAMGAVWEEMARTTAIPSRGPGVFGPDVRAILLSLNDEQKKRYLDPVLKGEKTTAMAQTEPDAGGDPGGMRTTAVLKGDHYVINGNKRFILHAKKAAFIQLIAATDREKGSRGGLSAFLVDMDTPGVAISGHSKHMMGETTWEISFDDVKVPVANRIGAEGEGMKLAQSWIGGSRVYQAARGLGVASRCIEMMATYAQQRVTFGKPLSTRQSIQFDLANLYSRHAAVQALTYRTAARLDAGTAGRHETFMIKILGTELGFDAADRCMQLHGGMGTTTEMPIEQMWRDSRSFMITGGAVEIMRSALSREIFAMYR
jgi:acyl-CoA dehydrogenase